MAGSIPMGLRCAVLVSPGESCARSHTTFAREAEPSEPVELRGPQPTVNRRAYLLLPGAQGMFFSVNVTFAPGASWMPVAVTPQ